MMNVLGHKKKCLVSGNMNYFSWAGRLDFFFNFFLCYKNASKQVFFSHKMFKQVVPV